MSKIKIIYDASIIAKGNELTSRTGIYFVAANILKELLKREDLELSFYCRKSEFLFLEEELKKNFGVRKPEIITTVDKTLFKLNSNLYLYKKQIRETKQYLKKFFVQIGLLILSILIKTQDSLNFNSHINNYDCFFSPIYKIPRLINKSKKLKKYVFLHDAIPLLFPDINPGSAPNSWYSQLIKTLNKDDYYFANSISTKNDMLNLIPSLDPKKVKTVLLACDEKFKKCDINQIQNVKLKYNIPTDQKYVLSLCTLEPRKNLIRAAKTFIEFIKKNNIDDMVFILGGGHWETFIDRLNKEIHNLGDYQDKILKIGYVDDDDLAPLYSGAEWFTYTSQYEGFGLPPLEAMSCGCPVITSNNSSLPEVIGDAGIMIDWDSDEQHIQAYEKYYFNYELKKEFAQKGLERAKQFSWEKCVNEMVDFMTMDFLTY